MGDVWGLEWLDQNSQRNYPLSEDASAADVTGAFTLPTSFLLELQLPVHGGLVVTPENFFLSLLTITPNGYVIGVSYDDGTDNPPLVALAQLNRAQHTENGVYQLVGQGDFFDTFGSVTIGILDDIDLQPPGSWTFNKAGGLLDSDCIRPQLRGITSISISNGVSTSNGIVGDVVLVSGTNIQLTGISMGGGVGIRIDAIDGSLLNETSPCTADANLPAPIRTINMIPGDNNGNFTITAGTCIQIDTITNGLQLSDTCSSPCCGCAELDAIMTQLDTMATQVPSLTSFVTELRTQVAAMTQTVLASRLNDVGTCP